MSAGTHPMDIKPTSRAQEYLQILLDLWPLALISGTLALLTFGHKVKASYLQRNPRQIAFNMFWSAGTTMALVVGTISLLDHFVPDLSASVQVGLAIAIGLGGIKFIDLITLKYFGLKVTDYMDTDLIALDKDKMTPEQRQQHYQQCPFRAECHKYGCPVPEESPRRAETQGKE